MKKRAKRSAPRCEAVHTWVKPRIGHHQSKLKVGPDGHRSHTAHITCRCGWWMEVTASVSDDALWAIGQLFYSHQSGAVLC